MPGGSGLDYIWGGVIIWRAFSSTAGLRQLLGRVLGCSPPPTKYSRLLGYLDARGWGVRLPPKHSRLFGYVDAGV